MTRLSFIVCEIATLSDKFGSNSGSINQIFIPPHDCLAQKWVETFSHHSFLQQLFDGLSGIET